MAKRAVRFIFGLLVFAVLVSIAGFALMYVMVGREPSVSRNSTLVLRLDDDLAEVPTDGVVQQILSANQPRGLPAVLARPRLGEKQDVACLEGEPRLELLPVGVEVLIDVFLGHGDPEGHAPPDDALDH